MSQLLDMQGCVEFNQTLLRRAIYIVPTKLEACVEACACNQSHISFGEACFKVDNTLCI